MLSKIPHRSNSTIANYLAGSYQSDRNVVSGDGFTEKRVEVIRLSWPSRQYRTHHQYWLAGPSWQSVSQKQQLRIYLTGLGVDCESATVGICRSSFFRGVVLSRVRSRSTWVKVGWVFQGPAPLKQRLTLLDQTFKSILLVGDLERCRKPRQQPSLGTPKDSTR